MSSRILVCASAGLAVVALGTAVALPAGATEHRIGAAHHSSVGSPSTHAIKNKTCASQRDNDNGVGIVSQNFEPSLDAYDSRGADDLKCKKGTGLAAYKIKFITADGIYFNGSGPADSYNVTYYKNSGGLPGAIVKDCPNSSYTDTGFGSPMVTCKVKLKKGTFWVSVQANLAFSAGGEWGWNTNNTVRGTASVWENPGDGFGTGCTTYTTTTTCIPSGEGGDFSYALS